MFIHISEHDVVTKTELNKITRSKLEKNIIGRTIVMDYISEVNGNRYIWNYRKNDGIFQPVCSKQDAEMITIDNGERIIKTIYFN